MTNPELPDERPQRRREYSGPVSTLGVAALIVLAVGITLWFFEFRDNSSASSVSEPGLGVVQLPASLNPTGKAPAAEQGRAAPNFKLATVDGGAQALQDFRGKYVLVNFWASWCGPCRGETPELQAFYSQEKGKPFIVVGVNQQETPSDAAAFVKDFGVTYPMLLDRSGDVSQAYRVGHGLPESFLIDPNGVIQKTYLGALQPTDLEQIVAEYLS